MIDVYESAVDDDGRYGAVFERDDETTYFYLLDLSRTEDQIIEAFAAYSINDMPVRTAIAVHWNSAGDLVGLFANDELIAVFDLKNLGNEPCGRWATLEDEKHFARH